jgi:hypothetical protein
VERPGLIAQTGVRLGIAQAALVAALLACAAVRLGPAEVEVTVALLAGLACIGLPLPASAWTGVVAWALYTGFVVHRYGTLTLGAQDLARLLLITASTVVVAACATRLPAVSRPPRQEARR